MMKKLITATALAMVLAGPAFAQQTPPNSNSSELNERGTIGSAPDYGRRLSGARSNDQYSGQYGGQQQSAAPSSRGPQGRQAQPYDARRFGPNHPDANGLNDQPKNSGDTNGG